MKRLILLAALSAIVFAKPKPETYKETEDFQYSRSSSDDGTKSGFYGAQRGNMGGNYERAHNMDTLAQHQMSGLVTQVDGELGEGAKTRTGSVYTAANSRGIYGSGHYDLSNLQGRNFAEGESFGNTHSSLSSQNSRYGGQSYSGMESARSSSHSQDSRYSGYQSSRHADQIQTDNLQAVDTSQGLGRYESNQAGYNMNYNTQYGSRRQSEIEQSSANLHSIRGSDANSQAHYITTPVRVVVRPGGRVAIPISAPTYQVSQNLLPENNGINSDAEVINQQSGSTPTSKVKHYEASYSYRKQWEKHHSVPGDASIVVVPTESPFPKNSELYEDAQLLQSSKNQLQHANSQIVHYSNMNTDQRAYGKSDSSRSRLHAGYNSQQRNSGLNSLQTQSGLGSHSQSGLSSEQTQLDFDEQQSHMGFNSQQSSASSATRANTYGSKLQTSGTTADLINAAGNIDSKPKSYHSSYSYHKSWERQGDPYVIKPVGPVYDSQASDRLTAASSNSAAYSSSRQYGSHSRQAHQSYSADCDDQGHIRVARSYNSDQQLEQGQNQWADLGQQTETRLENLEDLGQQTETKLENLEDLGQQQQNNWSNLQDLQQSQQWDNLQQVGQETQNQWDNLEQLGQQTQNQWDNLQQLGQQTQSKWDNLEDFNQQTHRDMEQHQNENLEDFNLSQKQDAVPNFEQQVNSDNEKLNIISEHQKDDAATNFEQQTNSENENLDIFSQHPQRENPLMNFEQQTNSGRDLSSFFTEDLQKENPPTNFEQQVNQIENEEMGQHTQKDVLTNFEQQSSDQHENLDVQKENPIENFEQQVNNQNEKLPNINNWDQTIGLIPQSNSPSNENLPLNTNHGVFEQNQQNEWHMYQSNANVDKNIDSYDFMQPFSQQTDNIARNSHHHEVEGTIQNLFPNIPSSNIEHNKFWHGIQEQNTFWNTNDKHEHNFWHTNNLNNYNNQFENGFPSSSIAGSDTGNPLQGLWSKIDNIAGEVTLTEGNKLFPNDYSNIFPQNQNVPKVPFSANTNMDSNNANKDQESSEKQLIHNNLFDDHTERPNTNTTVLPILVSTTPNAENASKSSDNHEKQPYGPNEEVGRGDIEPQDLPLEIETFLKPYKTPQEVETSSLTKEPQLPKADDVIIKPTSKIELSISNAGQKEQIGQNTQYELLSNVQSSTTKIHTIEKSTTVKSENHYPQPSNQPNTPILDLSSNPSSDSDKGVPPQHIVRNLETSDVHQQQNFDQQYDDLSQINLQHGYDQINMEQHFEDFQQHESMPDGFFLQDFGQNKQSPHLKVLYDKVDQEDTIQSQDLSILNHSNNEEASLPSSVSKDTVTSYPKTMKPGHTSQIEGIDSQNLPENHKDLNSKSENIESPVEESTTKPGFWKSIGNKFTGAKNKVVSWFSSS